MTQSIPAMLTILLMDNGCDFDGDKDAIRAVNFVNFIMLTRRRRCDASGGGIGGGSRGGSGPGGDEDGP